MPGNTPLTAVEARHLLRRTGFGAPRANVDALVGRTRGDVVAALLSFVPQGFQPGGRRPSNQDDKWIKFMVKAKRPLQEKLVPFWLDHFATGVSKVVVTKLMGLQNKIFRLHCKGDFRDVYGTVFKHWLNMPPASIAPGVLPIDADPPPSIGRRRTSISRSLRSSQGGSLPLR
jgi:hypothetical protein